MNDLDFKYLMQDFSNYYIGARLSYEEMIDQDDMPGRLRSAIFKYMEDETSLDVRICDHLLSMEKKSKSAMIYSQLKTEITVLPNAAAGRHKQTIVKADDFFADDMLRSSLTPDEISELRFKKKNLMFLRV
ncbi:MAG: hypothetical protein K6E75_06815 [Lachnospiraceae bacterium]|nr:hypothetical protein [Lachnospiraceae bacterium]MCR5338252.1 hypothetical protein [Lachnospiraceae bacterium]